MTDYDLVCVDDLPGNGIDYTYESKSNDMVSKLDHCIVSQNLVTHFKDGLCLHDIDNSSDLFPLITSFHIDIKHAYNKLSEKRRIIMA